MRTDPHVESILDALRTGTAPTLLPSHLTVLSAYPGLDGTISAEIASTRAAVTLTAAAGRAHAIVEAPTVPILGGFEAQYLALVTAATGGVLLDFAPLGAETLHGCGYSSSTDAITLRGHGYSAGDRVAFFAGPARPVPGGLVQGTLYYVLAPAADSFQIEGSLGGGAIDLTTDGECLVQRCAPQDYAVPGDLLVSGYTMTSFH